MILGSTTLAGSSGLFGRAVGSEECGKRGWSAYLRPSQAGPLTTKLKGQPSSSNGWLPLPSPMWGLSYPLWSGIRGDICPSPRPRSDPKAISTWNTCGHCAIRLLALSRCVGPFLLARDLALSMQDPIRASYRAEGSLEVGPQSIDEQRRE